MRRCASQPVVVLRILPKQEMQLMTSCKGPKEAQCLPCTG